MSKLEETNSMIGVMNKIADAGLDVDKITPIVLADIAKSLAMIADKLCDTESEVKEKESIPYIMHKEMDIPLLECQKAYDVAVEYLREKGKLKG